ncbi:MAG: hypothetical protein ACRD82_18625 [Blastocatellia bacterium]
MTSQSKLLKLATLGVFGVLGLIYSFTGSPVDAFSAGPPVGRTGAPALGTFPAELTPVRAVTVHSYSIPARAL